MLAAALRKFLAAAGFADAGVAPGNRVLLRGYNGLELYAAWLAVMKTGAIAVTTMPMLRAPELTAIIGKARPAFALSDHRLLAEVQAVAAPGGVGTVIAWGNGDLEARMAAASDRFTNADTAADDVSGLAYYGFRYYSASLGRFINRDPIGEAGGLNVYGFAGNDGINGGDLYGLAWWNPFSWNWSGAWSGCACRRGGAGRCPRWP